MRLRVHSLLAPLAALLFLAPAARAQQLTSPEQQFGHPIGADYVLPNYTELTAYWQKLSRESDRMVLDTIGTTAEGRPQLMAIVTSPANHQRLERYRQIAETLGRARVSEEEARALAREGKAIVWIDGGLHATEVLGAQQLMETVWQLVSGQDEETLRILDNVIILAVHANPDGMELVSDWYMRVPEPTERSTGGIPRLYQKYIGHDNNRDFYMSAQPETENMNRVMYHEWYPQIVYNHHQTGPQGTVLFAPPFRDPFNHHFDPLVVTGIDMVGAAMHNRFILEGKPGATMRSGAGYSTWWNGGLRTTTYFHNMIGLLTETIGNPTPMQIPFLTSRQLPSADLPAPIEPQAWHFRQSIEYSVTANKAVLDLASRNKDHFLFNFWRMGRNSIERGSRDNWTHYPRRIAAAAESLAANRGQGGQGGGFGGAARGTQEDFQRLLRDPALRDARGYIIPSDQPDFPTATKFVEALLETGIEVDRATSAFEVNGKRYPAGSYVVKTTQAFRPHVLDMFEPQDHPDDFAYPGAAPTPPYDNAGWTLAFQMGVQFDRVLEGFDGPFERVQGFHLAPPPGRISGNGRAGYLLSHQVNDAFIAVNRLMAANKDVFWLTDAVTVDGTQYPAGTFFIPEAGGVRPILEAVARDKGVNFTAVAARPQAEALRVEPVRVGLWDRYGGSMPSGWTRWLLEQFEFPFEVVYPQRLNAGDLDDDFDVLVFVDGAIPGGGGGGFGGGGFGGGNNANIPQEFQHMLGSVTVDSTIPQIRRFLEDGGTVVTIGRSTSLARHLGLPISPAPARDGVELESEEFYVPGSLLQARVDNTLPAAHGMPEYADFMFDNSPSFTLGPEAAAQGIQPIAWFDSPAPLRSGWAWGEEHLEGAVAAAQATVGDGTLFLFGPEIAFRAQPHGTFKLLFNSIYSGGAERARVR